MHTMHQIDFQLAVSAKQVTNDCRLIGKLRKGWNDGVCHKGALICPGALVPGIGQTLCPGALVPAIGQSLCPGALVPAIGPEKVGR